MNASVLIALSLAFLQAVLESAKVNGAAVEVIENLEAAIAKLLTVQGTDVTFEQLEGLKFPTPKW